MIINISTMTDIKIESNVVSTLLFHPQYVLSSENLKPEHFSDRTNRCIYWAIKELYKNKIKDIDYINIRRTLDSNIRYKKSSEELTEKVINEYITMAVEIARSSLEDYKLFADNVIILAYKRATYKKAMGIQNACVDENLSVQDIQKMFFETMNQLSSGFMIENNEKVFGECIDELWKETIERQKGGYYGTLSKFKKLNEYAPFENGELIIVAAQRKTGKSAYAMSEAIDKMEKDIPLLYLDTELSSRLFMERMLSNISGVSSKKIKSGDWTAEENKEIKRAMDFIKSKKFVHIYKSKWTPDAIYSTVMAWKQKIDIQFVIYDYMKSSGATGASEVYNDLGNLTNFLKNDIAGGFNLPVLSCAQLSRTGDIADSYKIEQYASTILNLYKKLPDEIAIDGADCGNYKLFVKANRNGECMDDMRYEYIDLKFTGNTLNFTQADKQHAEHKEAF